jgi:hypothetical protein
LDVVISGLHFLLCVPHWRLRSPLKAALPEDHLLFGLICQGDRMAETDLAWVGTALVSAIFFIDARPRRNLP